MEITFTIDWLHVNEPFAPYSLPSSHMMNIPGLNRISPCTPRHGYTEAFTNQAGCQVMRNPNRSDMGVHVSYSGKTLNTYRDNDLDPLGIVRWHLHRKGNVTRIDLAFDMRDSTLHPSTLYGMLDRKQAKTVAKSYNLIVGNDGGATLYIGSRQSEAFLRIYDKGIESGEGGDWIRVELELKASKAQFAAYTMANEPDNRAYQWAQAWLNGFVAFDCHEWIVLMTTTAIPLARANKPEKDTRKWLLEQVAPAMARYMARTGDYKLLTDFMAILRSGEPID